MVVHATVLVLIGRSPAVEAPGPVAARGEAVEVTEVGQETAAKSPPGPVTPPPKATRRSRAAARRLPRAAPVSYADISALRASPEHVEADHGDLDQPDREDDGDGREAPGPPPTTPTHGSEAAAGAETDIAPSRAPVVAADTARSLRVYDNFPRLLEQAALVRAEVVVEVCVSDHGRVNDAVIARSSASALDGPLRTAIRSWRYRPLLVNGAPTPFCHFMRISYAMN